MSRITHDKEIAGRGNKKSFERIGTRLNEVAWLGWVGPLSLVVLKVLMLLKLFLEIDAQGLTLPQTKKKNTQQGRKKEPHDIIKDIF